MIEHPYPFGLWALDFRISIFQASELPEKSDVVLEQQPDIIDAVMKHGDPLNAHSEGKARVFLRVVPDMSEHLRVDHTAAEALDPPCFGTDPAPLPAANDASHVNLGTGLGKGEETWSESHRYFTAEELVDKLDEYTLEVAEGDTLIYHKTLNLMKHGRVCNIVIVSVDSSR